MASTFPPAEETRTIGSFGAVEKIRVPSWLQEPLLPSAASHSVTAGEPARSTFFSFPSAKKAMKRLSGDQKGHIAWFVPGRGRVVSESRGRSQSRSSPSELILNVR